VHEWMKREKRFECHKSTPRPTRGNTRCSSVVNIFFFLFIIKVFWIPNEMYSKIKKKPPVLTLDIFRMPYRQPLPRKCFWTCIFYPPQKCGGLKLWAPRGFFFFFCGDEMWSGHMKRTNKDQYLSTCNIIVLHI